LIYSSDELQRDSIINSFLSKSGNEFNLKNDELISEEKFYEVLGSLDFVEDRQKAYLVFFELNNLVDGSATPEIKANKPLRCNEVY